MPQRHSQGREGGATQRSRHGTRSGGWMRARVSMHVLQGRIAKLLKEVAAQPLTLLTKHPNIDADK